MCFKNLFALRIFVNKCYFSNLVKSEKTDGPVIHHLNDDQKALIVRLDLLLLRFVNNMRTSNDFQGPVVRKPINANPRLKVNRGFHSLVITVVNSCF